MIRFTYATKEDIKEYRKAHPAKPTRRSLFKKEILAEADYSCICCGKTSSLEIHHANGDNRDNSRGNLLVLCKSCHRKKHNGPYKVKVIRHTFGEIRNCLDHLMSAKYLCCKELIKKMEHEGKDISYYHLIRGINGQKNKSTLLAVKTALDFLERESKDTQEQRDFAKNA